MSYDLATKQWFARRGEGWGDVEVTSLIFYEKSLENREMAYL